ncbi:uncharacterized protein LOC120347687 isoform X1 [Styela clava]
MSYKYFRSVNVAILSSVVSRTVTACRRSCPGISENSDTNEVCPYTPQEIRNVIGFIILGIGGLAVLGFLIMKITIRCRKYCLEQIHRRKARRPPKRTSSNAQRIENVSMYASSPHTVYASSRQVGTPLIRTPLIQRPHNIPSSRPQRLTTPATKQGGRCSPYREVTDSASPRNVKFEDEVIKAKVNDYLRKLQTDKGLNKRHHRRSRGGGTGADENVENTSGRGGLTVPNVSPFSSTSSLYEFDAISVSSAYAGSEIHDDHPDLNENEEMTQIPPIEVRVEDVDGEFNAGAPGEESEEFFRGGEGGFETVDNVD